MSSLTIQIQNKLHKPAFEAFYAKVKGLFAFAPKAYELHREEERFVVLPVFYPVKPLLYNGIQSKNT